MTVNHDVFGLPSIAEPACFGLSGAPLGEKTVALTGLMIGPGRVQAPNPSVNHATAAAVNTMTPTSATSAAVRPLLPFAAFSRGDLARDGDNRRFGGASAEKLTIVVGVEGVAVPDATDLDLVAVCKLTRYELSLYLDGNGSTPVVDRVIWHQMERQGPTLILRCRPRFA